MTDEQIIKAFRLCHRLNGTIPCFECPYYSVDTDKCLGDNNTDILDLINRQQAEIERLKAKCENTQVGYNIARTETEEYKTINKSLKADRPFLIKNARAEAIKECIEKTQAFLAIKCRGVVEDNPNLDEIIWGYRKEDVDEFFDNLEKEMVGDTE